MWILLLNRCTLRLNAMHLVSVLILPAGTGVEHLRVRGLGRNVEGLATLVSAILSVVAN
jgi:hypothetical protein